MDIQIGQNISIQNGHSQSSLDGIKSEGLLSGVLTSRPAWQYIVTFLLGVVIYDQGEQCSTEHLNI